VTPDRHGWVIDASVGIKLVVPEPLSDRAHALVSHLRNPEPARLFVPDLFYMECANVLWKYTRRHGLSHADARAAIRALGALAFIRVSNAGLLEDSLNLATSLGISACDALYASIARRYGSPLVSADQRLVRVLQAAGLPAVSLEEI